MKTYIQHDAEGIIKSIISLDAPAEAGLFLSQTAGTHFSEIEGLKIKKGMPDVDELRAMAKAHRITDFKSKAVLSKK